MRAVSEVRVKPPVVDRLEGTAVSCQRAPRVEALRRTRSRGRVVASEDGVAIGNVREPAHVCDGVDSRGAPKSSTRSAPRDCDVSERSVGCSSEDATAAESDRNQAGGGRDVAHCQVEEGRCPRRAACPDARRTPRSERIGSRTTKPPASIPSRVQGARIREARTQFMFAGRRVARGQVDRSTGLALLFFALCHRCTDPVGGQSVGISCSSSRRR